MIKGFKLAPIFGVVVFFLSGGKAWAEPEVQTAVPSPTPETASPSGSVAFATPATSPEPERQPPPPLVEPFTAYTLPQGMLQLGTFLDYGITDRIQIGTDLLATVLGAPTLHLKANVYQNENNTFALGLREGYLSKHTLFWGGASDEFDELSAQVLRPSISWSHILSPRLKLHSHYSTGIGHMSAKLSDKGKRRLYESKHPDGDYDRRQTNSNPGSVEDENGNSEKVDGEGSPLAQRSLQVQSLAGLQSDLFQITGEFLRRNGNKILVTTRMEEIALEDLKGTIARLTAAQQWIWPHFQIRLGIGLQYVVVSGHDLDGETLSESDLLPASDCEFYWRF